MVHEIDRSVHIADSDCAELVYKRNRRIEWRLRNTDIRECVFVSVTVANCL